MSCATRRSTRRTSRGLEAAPIDLQEAIRGALERRTDVSRARRQLDANEATATARCRRSTWWGATN